MVNGKLVELMFGTNSAQPIEALIVVQQTSILFS